MIGALYPTKMILIFLISDDITKDILSLTPLPKQAR